MTEETRRARCAWALSDAAGARTKQGDGEAAIDDAGLGVGTVRVDFLDADVLRAADYSVELDLWPAGKLVLTELGRRFDTFSAALRQARNQARVAGLLAHAPAMPEVFNGALLLPAPGARSSCRFTPRTSRWFRPMRTPGRFHSARSTT